MNLFSRHKMACGPALSSTQGPTFHMQTQACQEGDAGMEKAPEKFDVLHR